MHFNSTCRHGLVFVGLLFAGAQCGGSEFEIDGDDPVPTVSTKRDGGVENRNLIGAIVRGRVTQRFEIYNPHSEDQLRAIKRMGFTQVILDWPNLHAVASGMGLDVVLANWWTPQTEVPDVEKGIEQARQVDRKRLVAVSMMDEPERNSPQTPFSYYEALYADLRERFDKELPLSGVKLEISHWGPLRSWTGEQYRSFTPLYMGCDRMRIMPYPDLDEGPLNEVYFQIMRSRHLMKLAGREVPLVVILQTWMLPENSKLPTVDELRVMAYQAMLCDTEALSFYNYDPELWQKTPGFTDGFADLMRELTQFSQRYRDATVETQMSPDGILSARLIVPGQEVVDVVVNTNREPAMGMDALQVVFQSSVQPVPVRPRRIFQGRWWRHRR